MHYKVGSHNIPSHLAARSHHQKSSELVGYLRALGKFKHTLDYGCGKLRYFRQLKAKADQITLCDSPDQIAKIQMILDEKTTLKDFASNHGDSVRVFNPAELAADKSVYDFILCSNVLSAVPHRDERLKILKTVKSKLSDHGLFLLVNQFRNTYFRDLLKSPKSRIHYDGFISRNRGVTSAFYGLITPKRSRKLIELSGLNIVREIVRKESVYHFVTKRNTRLSPEIMGKLNDL